jgi:hypothetical protein
VKSHFGKPLANTGNETVYTAHTHRHPAVVSSDAMGEVTDVRGNKS